jgi:hypothetical protein
MKTAMLFVAGAMFLSTAYGSDPGYAERFKMKTGRNAQAAEARVKQAMNCPKHVCCAKPKAVAKSDGFLGDPGAEARFRMKYGRSSPAEEARVAAARRPTNEPVLIASAMMCERECCK